VLSASENFFRPPLRGPYGRLVNWQKLRLPLAYFSRFIDRNYVFLCHGYILLDYANFIINLFHLKFGIILIFLDSQNVFS
jgi:hypothetical protein